MRPWSVRSPQFAEIVEHLNRSTLAVVQFETTTAFERADELLSVKGMDIAMVGPADLSISLGIPGQMDNPLLVSTVERLIEKCNRHSIVPGIQTRSVAMAKAWVERGMRFVGAAAEHGLPARKVARSRLRTPRRAVGREGPDTPSQGAGCRLGALRHADAGVCLRILAGRLDPLV